MHKLAKSLTQLIFHEETQMYVQFRRQATASCDGLSLRLLYLTSPDTWSQGPPSKCVIFNLPDSSANDQEEPKQR